VAFGGIGGAAVHRARAISWLTDLAPPPNPHVARRQRNASQPRRHPELDCVRDLLPQRILAAAERRARSVGVGAERVLICADAVTEEAYLTALADSLGTTYERFDGISRTACPLDDDQLVQAAAAGLLPLRDGRGLAWIIAPRGLTARRLADPRQQRPPWLKSFRLTSADRLRDFVLRHGQRALGRRAADGLRLQRPLFSNAPPEGGTRALRTLALVAAAFVFFALAPLPVIEGLSGLCCALFLAAALLRVLSACFGGVTAAEGPARRDDRELPIYTVICALYREAAVVGQLVGAIRALDYPPEKLDVKFVLEADDRDTRRALLDLNPGPPFEIIVAPPIGPRTKPKALNFVLPLARGAYTVVYDAEDKPEPDQLRRALDAFRKGGKRLACVQASLTIDNTADNWLAGMFTANYAGQFDVFLRGLAALRLPFPLGGSSNHFRTMALRKAGGWDSYNVTEDADLGIRLYRLGYRAAAIASTTYEEAPARFVPWLKQRTRWYKGWMHPCQWENLLVFSTDITWHA
jgi:glycosyltransferase XagB